MGARAGSHAGLPAPPHTGHLGGLLLMVLCHNNQKGLFKIFYLFMRDTQREAEGEAGSLRDPDAGLDPRTPGSRPEPKADAQLLSHPDAPRSKFL